VNIVVNSIFASHQGGAAAWLNYAFRLMQLPLGLFGVAVGTIATAGLARQAAGRDMAGMRTTLAQSLRLVAFLTLPATLGLIALAQPVIRMIYEHGQFGPSDTLATGRALLFYALGLFAYSSVKVVAPAFYSLNRARVPLCASASAVIANLALNFALFPVLGYQGLALGTSLAATVNFLVLAISFHRSYGGLRDRDLWLAVAKMTLASLVMAVAAYGASQTLAHFLGIARLPAQLAGALLPVAIGILVYGVVCRGLRIAEVDDFLSLLRRRRPGTAPLKQR
jgi:putative peptidoglycan lipid II flippase